MKVIGKQALTCWILRSRILRKDHRKLIAWLYWMLVYHSLTLPLPSGVLNKPHLTLIDLIVSEHPSTWLIKETLPLKKYACWKKGTSTINYNRSDKKYYLTVLLFVDQIWINISAEKFEENLQDVQSGRSEHWQFNIVAHPTWRFKDNTWGTLKINPFLGITEGLYFPLS